MQPAKVSSMNVFLRLPVELSGGVLGKWLDLKDLARLDSSFCHNASRKIFHKILQSPLCILESRVGAEVATTEDIRSWFYTKKVRITRVLLWGDENGTLPEQCVPYLEEIGRHITHITLGNIRNIKETFEVIHYCTNICSIFVLALELSVEFVRGIATFPHLQTVVLGHSTILDEGFLDLSDSPGSLLRLKSIQLNCVDESDALFLKLCAPETIQRLQIKEKFALQWNMFTSLRSVGFNPFDTDCAASVSHVLRRCPWVVNLDLMHVDLTPDLKKALMHSGAQLRTLNLDNGSSWSDSDLAEVIVRHKSSLERLYLYFCSVSAASVNLALSTCPNLHTLSCTTLAGVDTSLMKNITTLGVGTGEYVYLIPLCTQLQHLYLRQTMAYIDVDVMVSFLAALVELPVLRSVTLIGMLEYSRTPIQHQLSVYRPSVSVVIKEQDESAWYNLFELPI